STQEKRREKMVSNMEEGRERGDNVVEISHLNNNYLEKSDKKIIYFFNSHDILSSKIGVVQKHFRAGGGSV
ncbi:hypothetical protein ACLD5S_05990, partial [Gardnerella vaginalis]|uniref:hypothetical protein n=1 Tax=Gardnerella vaginalis TaxID=2702 RepID=UPI003970AE4C